MANDIEDSVDTLRAKIDELINTNKNLNDRVDLLELEQDLLDSKLTHLFNNYGDNEVVDFCRAYLEYRDTMTVKDAVETTIEDMNLEEEEEEEEESTDEEEKE